MTNDPDQGQGAAHDNGPKYGDDVPIELPAMPSSGPGAAEALAAQQDTAIPDGGYGWVMVACIGAVNASTWGMNTTYGVFSAYYIQHNYFRGGSTFNYAWVGGLSVAVAVACGPLGNWLNRTLGLRPTMALGTLFVALGQILAGLCTNFAGFLVCQGLVFGLGLGILLVTVSPLLAHFFHRKLAIAQGLSAAGSGVGGLIFANTTRVMLEKLGVKWALIINGLISAAIISPTIFLLRTRDKQLGAKSLSFEARWIWHPGYLWVILWASSSMIAYFIAIYSLASFATHGLGLSQTQGASLQSILAAGQMLGRPLWGLLLDKGGRINMTMICYIIVGVSSLAIWLPARSYGVLAFYAIIQGLTGGTVWSAAPPVTAQIVGVTHIASALSILFMALVVPALIGEPLAILLLNYSTGHQGRTGPEAYNNSIGFCGAMAIAGALFLLGAKRYHQKDWAMLAKS